MEYAALATLSRISKAAQSKLVNIGVGYEGRSY
jgi:hypothetical protein